MSEFYNSFLVLEQILDKGSYANIALSKYSFQNQAKVTVITYGVIENYYHLNQILNSLVKRKPNSKIKIILLIGIFSILHLNTPNYVIVNECVNVAKKINQISSAGFVNAVLKKVCNKEYKVDINNPECKYNIPLWLYEKIKKQYPLQYEDILKKSGENKVEFRLRHRLKENENYDKTEVNNFLLNFEKAKQKKEIITLEYGYSAKLNDFLKQSFEKGFATAQSHGSILICKLFGNAENAYILDACAAPGGKSIYLAEHGAKIDALDIHMHRVKLIEAYAKRMKVNINTYLEDSTIPNKSRHNLYDAVLVDAPCSGLGVLNKRQDIVLNIQENDILSLSKIQFNLISNCAKYVKKGGFLVYSTCTILREENEEIIEKFLKTHNDFELEKIELNKYLDDSLRFLKLLPNINSEEGFFAAKLKKRNN